MIRRPVLYFWLYFAIFVKGLVTCEFWDISNKVPIAREKPTSCWRYSHLPLALQPQPPFPFTVVSKREWDLQCAMSSVLSNGSAGFPELPVLLFLILAWALSWNVILHCTVLKTLLSSPENCFYSPPHSRCWCCMPRMLLGRRWQLVPAWWSVTLQGDLAVCLALYVVPHSNYHCSAVSGDNRVSAWAAQNISSSCCL